MSYSQLVLDEAARKIVATAIAEGKLEINTTEEVDARGFASAQANAENITSDIIRKGVTILGVPGAFGEALTYDVLATGCSVTLYRFIDTEWVDVSEGSLEGEIALGAKYRITVRANQGSEMTLLRCNGVDLAITDKVEEATTVYADPENGLNILAVAVSGGSSSSYAE